MPGTLFLVATPIGNLEDITLRALRILKDVGLIAAEDTRHTAKLLTHFGIATRTSSLHAHNERSAIPKLISALQAGTDVAVVTDAGMPTISDPGYGVVAAARESGIRVEVVPGASALTAAVAGSGLSSETVTFVGFPPPRQGERQRWFEAKRGIPGTLVLFEAPTRVRQTLRTIADTLGDPYIVIARELTKVHESWYRGWASELSVEGAIPERGEFVILVSDQHREGQRATSVADDVVSDEFWRLTEVGLDRKEILAQLAETFHLPRRAVYAIVTRAKSRADAPASP